jgi:predicted negative regulator of RcsB-dependent stress response
MIGVAVLVVGGGAYVAYRWNQQARAESAERALYGAKVSVAQGNIALATADLRKVIQGYGGTSGAAEAALTLASLQYDEGNFQEGINTLEQSVKSAPATMVVSTHALIGEGYLELGKMEEAARAFEMAASASSYKGERASLRARAARAYATAGKDDQALAIWQELLRDPGDPAAAFEARIRIGELSVKPAG